MTYRCPICGYAITNGYCRFHGRVKPSRNFAIVDNNATRKRDKDEVFNSGHGESFYHAFDKAFGIRPVVVSFEESRREGDAHVG